MTNTLCAPLQKLGGYVSPLRDAQLFVLISVVDYATPPPSTSAAAAAAAAPGRLLPAAFVLDVPPLLLLTMMNH